MALKNAGSIPALAGQPIGGENPPTRQWVYPRAGGATPATRRTNRPPAGLSPRWRGNHGRKQFDGHRHRSIPALAGQPYGRGRMNKDIGVYPRAGGATLHVAGRLQIVRGLSPRWRGNQ